MNGNNISSYANTHGIANFFKQNWAAIVVFCGHGTHVHLVKYIIVWGLSVSVWAPNSMA